jgi:hypothetical protein
MSEEKKEPEVKIKTTEEQFAELDAKLHAISMFKLGKVAEFIMEIERLSKGVEDARTELIKCDSKEVKRWQAVISSWIGQKQVFREIRFAIKMKEAEEQKLRDLRAKKEMGA